MYNIYNIFGELSVDELIPPKKKPKVSKTKSSQLKDLLQKYHGNILPLLVSPVQKDQICQYQIIWGDNIYWAIQDLLLELGYQEAYRQRLTSVRVISLSDTHNHKELSQDLEIMFDSMINRTVKTVSKTKKIKKEL